MLNRIKPKLVSLSRKGILKANYYLNNYNEVIWLIGDGRSGTTWVSDLINHEKSYREMFEPFHPMLVRDANFIIPHQYMRRDGSNEDLEAFSAKVFSGKYTHERLDSENRSLRYSGLLIKDIFANLMSHWAVSQFQQVKPV